MSDVPCDKCGRPAGEPPLIGHRLCDDCKIGFELGLARREGLVVDADVARYIVEAVADVLFWNSEAESSYSDPIWRERALKFVSLSGHS